MISSSKRQNIRQFGAKLLKDFKNLIVIASLRLKNFGEKFVG